VVKPSFDDDKHTLHFAGEWLDFTLNKISTSNQKLTKSSFIHSTKIIANNVIWKLEFFTFCIQISKLSWATPKPRN